jgi:hypothetical protein
LEFAIQFAFDLVIFVCVACILDSPRVPPGAVEAGKIAPQANPVNSGVRTGGKCRSVRCCDYASTPAKRRSKSAGAINLFRFPRTRALPFFSQEKFFRSPKNKIHFFLVDFETGF